MNKKVFGYALLPALVLTLVGAGTASAHGMFGGGMSNATPEEIASRQQEMFTHQSTLLGISVDADGKCGRHMCWSVCNVHSLPHLTSGPCFPAT